MSDETNEVMAIKERFERSLLAKPNVTGVDVGYKYVGGKRTDEIAIRVFVKEKGEVGQEDAVPASIEGVKTDVIEEPDMELLVLRVPVGQPLIQEASAVSPLLGGISIGPCRAIGGVIYVGTLGVIVQDSLGTFYALSNFHVLCVDDGWVIGDDIAQPSRVDGGSCPANTIGSILSGCLADKYNCNNRSVDAALSTITSQDVSRSILNIGAVAGSTPAVLGTAVQKQGRTTGRTFGIIDGIGRSMTVDYGDGIGQVRLTNQISIVPDETRNPRFSDHGDSGSVVVDSHLHVVGLLFAGANDGSRSSANPFTDVELALEIQLFTGISIAMAVGATTVDGSRPYIFVVGADGNLWLNWWDGSSWHWTNQRTPGVAPAVVAIASAVGAITVANLPPLPPPFPNPPSRPYIFVVGADGNLWSNWWDGSSWHWTNQGTPGAAPAIASAVGAITVDGSRPYIFVVGTDGNLWSNWWDGSSWHWTNQGTPGVAPAGVAIASAVGAITVDDSPASRPYIFVVGADGNLWSNWWDGSSWHWTNQGTPGVAIAFAVGTTTVDGPFVVGADGNLWSNWWDGSSWDWINQGTPGVAIASAAGATAVDGSRSYIFVVGADGNLWSNWSDGSSWHWTNQGTPGAAPAIASAVGAITVDGSRPYIFVVGTDGHLWSNWWDGSNWHWDDHT